ncbi:MAG: sulfotransferase [Sandaracinaceae bacterium]
MTNAVHTALRSEKLNPRFASWVGGWAVLFTSIRGLVRASRAADDLLYPGWRDVDVRQPVFIVAQARSGTTLLHRLLALDEERFTTTKLYQTLLPSVSLYRAVDRAAQVDRRWLGGRLARAVAWLDERAFPGFKQVHPTSFNQPEEDECLFVYSLLSPTFFMLFPFVEELDRVRSVENMSPDDRARLMAYYDSCLQRHLHAEGEHRTMLIKNVLTASRLDALLEAYPDARIIYLLRHPYESIPSAISMFTMPWRVLFPGTRPEDFRAFGRLMTEYYRKYAELVDRLPPEQLMTIRFEELVRDPRETVGRIYRHFGWTLPPEVDARLRNACQAKAGHRSTHRYDLDDFGLSRDDVQRDLADLFDRYGFDR